MDIVDAHAHLASWHSVPESEGNLLLGMERHGIATTLVSHADCTSFPGEAQAPVTPLSSVEGLSQVIAFARKHPGRIYGAAWFKPLVEPVPPEGFVRLIQENRDIVKALKFHPFCERVALDDPRVAPYIQLARELDLPILVHTAVDEDSAIYHFVNAAKANPDVRFVAAHLELCSDHRYAIEALTGIENAWCDTAWVDLSTALLAMEKLGPDRVFFGTDAPIDGAATLDNPMYQEYFRALYEDPSDLMQGLMGANARRFYGL